jgi:hypothetical protein
MADLFYTIFIIWNYLWILGILCILLRADFKQVLIDVFSMMLQTNIFFILVSALLIYIFIPLTIPHSIKSIINKNEEQD